MRERERGSVCETEKWQVSDPLIPLPGYGRTETVKVLLAADPDVNVQVRATSWLLVRSY